MLTRKSVLAFLAFLMIPSLGSAGTLMKLGLGTGDGPDIAMITLPSGDQVLSTIDEGNADTAGDQDTDVGFITVLPTETDIAPDLASFSLSGVNLIGSPMAVLGGALVAQSTSGGTFELFDAANSLLLSGSLMDGSLSGPPGSPTGSFLTAALGDFTGGTLAPKLRTDSLSLSISLTDLATSIGQPGLVIDNNGSFTPFTSDATANVGAEPAVPEPASLPLLAIGILFAVRAWRKWK